MFLSTGETLNPLLRSINSFQQFLFSTMQYLWQPDLWDNISGLWIGLNFFILWTGQWQSLVTGLTLFEMKMQKRQSHSRVCISNLQSRQHLILSIDIFSLLIPCLEMMAKTKGLLTLQHSKFLFISPFPLQKWTSAACRSVCRNLQINSG